MDAVYLLILLALYGVILRRAVLDRGSSAIGTREIAQV